MERMLSAKATYICYEIESRLNCNYVNATELANHTGLEIEIEIPIIRDKIRKIYSYKVFKEMNTQDIIHDFINSIEKYILLMYIYKQEEKE